MKNILKRLLSSELWSLALLLLHSSLMKVSTFDRVHKARLGIIARIYQGEQLVVEFESVFVLLNA